MNTGFQEKQQKQNKMKKILMLLLFAISISSYSQTLTEVDTINTGTGVLNSGEKLKTAFPKVNDAIIQLNNIIERLNESLSLSEIVPYLADTVEFATYSAGMGLLADSTLFAKNEDSFGAVKVKTDTTVIVNIELLRISAGDSCKFNFYIGSYKTGVATDSLFTAPQGCGENQTTFTPNNETKVPPDSDLFMKMSGNQITGRRPYELSLQVNRYKIR